MLSLLMQNHPGCIGPIEQIGALMQRDQGNEYMPCRKGQDFVVPSALSFGDNDLNFEWGLQSLIAEPDNRFQSVGSSNSSSKWQAKSISLGPNFMPGPFDVICARGMGVWNHSGNKHFRALVKGAVDDYRAVKTRAERTNIVSRIVDSIRAKGTGFVKPDAGPGGEWIEVGDLLAREKVGQMLRNALSSKYRSSIKSKNHRRRNMHVKRLDGLHEIMASVHSIEHSMVTMKEGALHGNLSSEQILALFNQEQQDILKNIKAEEGLLERFLQAEIAASLVINRYPDADSEGDNHTDDGMDSDGDAQMTDD